MESIIDAINRTIEHSLNDGKERNGLSIGNWNLCERQLWLDQHEVSTKRLDADTLRSIEINVALKNIIRSWLVKAGARISHVGESIVNAEGIVILNIDGIVFFNGVYSLLQIKIVSNATFNDMQKHGIYHHYNAAIQLSMMLSKQLSKSANQLKETMYVIFNRATYDFTIHTEHYENMLAELTNETMEQVLTGEDMPAGKNSYLCKMCHYHKECNGSASEINISCKTCASVSKVAGNFVCHHGNSVCDQHIFHPQLVELMGYAVKGIDSVNKAICYEDIDGNEFILAAKGYFNKDKPVWSSVEFMNKYEDFKGDAFIKDIKTTFGGHIE